MSRPPELGCAVLSLAGDPRLVGAVRSLQAQAEPVEVVVVNSGGGEPAAKLRAAGIDVPVIDQPDRLFPGGARNLAIAATSAPYLAYLAADCRAEPGWIAGRLRAHRAGAAAVAGVMSNPFPESRIASASHLLLYPRRLAHTEPTRRLFYGLSYDRRLFDRYGRFREDMRSGEDTDFNRRFLEHAAVAWAPDVRTAHVYPTRLRDFLPDQYRRGRLQAIAFERVGEPKAARLARRAVGDVPLCVEMAWRTADPQERRSLLRTWPLLVPGALMFAAGALSHVVRPAAAATPERPRSARRAGTTEAPTTTPETPSP
jgi:glycosyltransferase involved in cell wall biosynthesis